MKVGSGRDDAPATRQGALSLYADLVFDIIYIMRTTNGLVSSYAAVVIGSPITIPVRSLNSRGDNTMSGCRFFISRPVSRAPPGRVPWPHREAGRPRATAAGIRTARLLPHCCTVKNARAGREMSRALSRPTRPPGAGCRGGRQNS